MFLDYGSEKRFVVKGYADANFDTNLDDSKSRSRYILKVGATLANCSHFQYVSRLRLGVIQIGVKACIIVTLYDELFITSITEKYFLSPLRIILTAVQ